MPCRNKHADNMVQKTDLVLRLLLISAFTTIENVCINHPINLLYNVHGVRYLQVNKPIIAIKVMPTGYRFYHKLPLCAQNIEQLHEHIKGQSNYVVSTVYSIWVESSQHNLHQNKTEFLYEQIFCLCYLCESC